MNRRQAINYLSNSGFSMIQIETIAKAFGTLSGEDFQELKDRYGDEVEYVVRDMISGENLRWVELLRPKKQEPTTKNETLVSLDVYKQVAKERDIAIQQLHELGYDFGQKIEPTDKNFTKADIDAIVKAINEGWELRVNEILSKIRAEIEQLTIVEGGDDYVRKMAELFSLKMKVLQIIDKYKAETEEA